MMVRLRCVDKALLFVLALSAGCASDTLNLNYPVLDLKVVPQPYYASSSDTPVPTIDLGAVPLLMTRVATFSVGNPSPIPLIIQSISFTAKSGERWSLPTVLPTEVAPWATLNESLKRFYADAPFPD